MSGYTQDATDRQREILDAIRAHMATTGYPPTIRELCAVVGITTNGINCHLMALERKGYIRRTPGQARSIVLLERT